MDIVRRKLMLVTIVTLTFLLYDFLVAVAVVVSYGP